MGDNVAKVVVDPLLDPIDEGYMLARPFSEHTNMNCSAVGTMMPKPRANAKTLAEQTAVSMASHKQLLDMVVSLTNRLNQLEVEVVDLRKELREQRGSDDSTTP